jgi:hypothetical protein
MRVHAHTPILSSTTHTTHHTPHATRDTSLHCQAGQSAYSFPSTDLSRLSPSVNAAFRCKAYHALPPRGLGPTDVFPCSRPPVFAFLSQRQLRRGCLFVAFLVGGSSTQGGDERSARPVATSAAGLSSPATSAPGLGSRLPHLHRNWAHPSHICTGTGRRCRCWHCWLFVVEPQSRRAQSAFGLSAR